MDMSGGGTEGGEGEQAGELRGPWEHEVELVDGGQQTHRKQI